MAPASSYSPVLAALAELRKRTARFRRVALHVHSPESHDWPTAGSDATINRRARFQAPNGAAEFAQELRKHFDLVAVTDHMRCGFACQVSADPGTTGALVVLPGMEVNFIPEAALGCLRIHLLVVLPEGSTPEAFARLFAGQPHIPSDAARIGQEEVSGIPLKTWVQRVHDERGLCIAAHVDNQQGVRCRFRQTSRAVLQLFSDASAATPQALEIASAVPDNLREYLFAAEIDAVEVSRTSDAPHYRWVSTVDGRM
jgi:hypothetical protein